MVRLLPLVPVLSSKSIYSDCSDTFNLQMFPHSPCLGTAYVVLTVGYYWRC